MCKQKTIRHSLPQAEALVRNEFSLIGKKQATIKINGQHSQGHWESSATMTFCLVMKLQISLCWEQIHNHYPREYLLHDTG